MIDSLCKWLAGTAASATIRDVSWIIPAIQTLHILCIAVVISAAALMNLKLVRWTGPGAEIAALDRRFVPAAWIGLVGLLLTGLILIVGEPARELKNFLFWTKMALVATVFSVTVAFHRSVLIHPEFWERSPRRTAAAKCFGVVSMIAWIAIVCAGRWIAYVGE
jgi:hypothetical protein